MSITITEERLALLFNSWMQDFKDNPDDYLELDESTPPTYGENCARHLIRLDKELES